MTGLYFNEEVGFIGSSAIGYVQSTGTSYLPVEGKSYHGRGPIQLSYNYNYGLCSDVLYGDSSILLNNPEKVTEDGVLGFMTGIWFWMTPQPPKPSCHQVITGTWQPKAGAANEQYNGNFGLTIIIINNEAGQSENGTVQSPAVRDIIVHMRQRWEPTLQMSKRYSGYDDLCSAAVVRNKYIMTAKKR